MLQVYIFRDTGSHSISRNESEWRNAFIASPRADSFQVNGRYPPANYWVTSAVQDFGILWAVSSQPMPALSGCRTWKNTTKHLLQRCGVWIGGKRLLNSLFAARVFLQHASFSFISTWEQPLAQWFSSFTKTPCRLQDLWRLHREARRECYRQWLLEARRSTENTLPSDGLFRKSSTVHREDLAATGWWHLGIERVYATRDQQLHLFLLNSFWIWKERTAQERERERER